MNNVRNLLSHLKLTCKNTFDNRHTGTVTKSSSASHGKRQMKLNGKLLLQIYWVSLHYQQSYCFWSWMYRTVQLKCRDEIHFICIQLLALYIPGEKKRIVCQIRSLVLYASGKLSTRNFVAGIGMWCAKNWKNIGGFVFFDESNVATNVLLRSVFPVHSEFYSKLLLCFRLRPKAFTAY